MGAYEDLIAAYKLVNPDPEYILCNPEAFEELLTRLRAGRGGAEVKREYRLGEGLWLKVLAEGYKVFVLDVAPQGVYFKIKRELMAGRLSLGRWDPETLAWDNVPIRE